MMKILVVTVEKYARLLLQVLLFLQFRLRPLQFREPQLGPVVEGIPHVSVKVIP